MVEKCAVINVVQDCGICKLFSLFQEEDSSLVHVNPGNPAKTSNSCAPWLLQNCRGFPDINTCFNLTQATNLAVSEKQPLETLI